MYPNRDIGEIQDRFENLGPTAHLCFAMDRSELTRWEEHQYKALVSQVQDLETGTSYELPLSQPWATTDYSYLFYITRRSRLHDPLFRPFLDFLQLFSFEFAILGIGAFFTQNRPKSTFDF
jgi:hypothetical protein